MAVNSPGTLASTNGVLIMIKERTMKKNVVLHCGWGRLIFGQTFDHHEEIINCFLDEEDGERDLAIYVDHHHILQAKAPKVLFIDPSVTYRLSLQNYKYLSEENEGFLIRPLLTKEDALAVNRIYKKTGLVSTDVETMLENQRTVVFQYFIAEDIETGTIIGTITGIDHWYAFQDSEYGASFWSLAVDPDQRANGVGRSLVRTIAGFYSARGRNYLDLSVLHDNKPAIELYKSMGFQAVPVYVVKRKNKINRSFYTGGPNP